MTVLTLTIDPEKLAFKSATEAAQAIRQGKTSSLALTKHQLRRIEKFNPKINAIIALMKEQALTRAVEADEVYANGKVWGPLHGVPITVKDLFEIKGIPTTCGSKQYENYIPESDGVVVQRLRQAGAVILGHTNVPELAADWQSYNDVYGTTLNPYDPEKTPGGSSG